MVVERIQRKEEEEKTYCLLIIPSFSTIPIYYYYSSKYTDVEVSFCSYVICNIHCPKVYHC
jgi:hypothetical protein